MFYENHRAHIRNYGAFILISSYLIPWGGITVKERPDIASLNTYNNENELRLFANDEGVYVKPT